MIDEQNQVETMSEASQPLKDETQTVEGEKSEMSNPETPLEPLQVEVAPDSPEGQVETVEGVASPEQMTTQLQQEVQILRQQLEEQTQQTEVLKKQRLTLAADFDNFRKRTEREREELKTRIKRETIIELLGVVDNFERARTQIKPANDGEMGIHKSYQGVYKNLVDSLKRLGVSAMRPEGEPFDPQYHEAMFREQTNEHPEGTVLEQLQRGYLLGDTVLRHAMVKVAAPQEDSGETVPSEDNYSEEPPKTEN